MRPIDDNLEIRARGKYLQGHERHIDLAISIYNLLPADVRNLVEILNFERILPKNKSGGYNDNKRMISINWEFIEKQIRTLQKAKKTILNNPDELYTFPKKMQYLLNCDIPTIEEKIIQSIIHEFVHPYLYSHHPDILKDLWGMIEGKNTRHSPGILVRVTKYAASYIDDLAKISRYPDRVQFYKETMTETLSNLWIGKGVGVNPKDLEIMEKRYQEWIARHGLFDFVKMLQSIKYQLGQ